MNRSLIILAGFLMLFISSCSLTGDETYDLKNVKTENYVPPKGLDSNVLTQISQDLEKALGGRRNGPSFSINYSDPEIEGIMAPLVDNGRSIHAQLLNQINNSSVWNTLSEEDKQSILNLTDQELAELSFIISITNQIVTTDVDWERIKNCGSAALGVGVVKELVKNTAALASAEVASQILLLVGKRTLGWVALGWLIWDFYDCVK